MRQTPYAYPAAITDAAVDPPGAAAAVIRWTYDRLLDNGGDVLLCVPRSNSLSDRPELRAMTTRPEVVVATWRTHGATGWRGGPVLAAWPTRDVLADLAQRYAVTALCVLSWNDQETRGWRRAVGPQLLGDQLHGQTSDQLRADRDRLVADPVVDVALGALTAMVNLGNHLASAMDHDDALVVLRVLHAGGHQLVADDVYAWALAHHWGGHGSARLAEIADGVTAGRRLQRKAPGRVPLRTGVLADWRTKASQR